MCPYRVCAARVLGAHTNAQGCKKLLNVRERKHVKTLSELVFLCARVPRPHARAHLPTPRALFPETAAHISRADGTEVDPKSTHIRAREHSAHAPLSLPLFSLPMAAGGRGLMGAALGAGLTAAHYNGVDIGAFLPKGGGSGGGGGNSAAVDRLSALVERLALDRGASLTPTVTLINPNGGGAATGKGGGALLTLAAVGGCALAAHALAPEWLPATRGSLARALAAVSKTVRAMGDALKQRVDGLDAKADALAAGQARLGDSVSAARADLESLASDVSSLTTDVARVGRDAGDAADGVGLLVRVVREILGGGRASTGAAAELDAFAARRRCAAAPPLASRKVGLESLLGGGAEA